MAKVLAMIVCVVMAGCSSLPSSLSRLELPELLPVSGGAGSSIAARTETRTAAADEPRSEDNFLDQYANETDWSPIELYGDSADMWLWDLNRTEYRAPSPGPVVRAKPSRTPVFRRAKSPSNFFLTSTETAEADSPRGSAPEDSKPNPLEPLRETQPDSSTPPTEVSTTPIPVATNAVAAQAPVGPPTSAAVEPVQPAGDVLSPPHPQVPEAARLSIIHPCFCRAVRARGDCDQAESAQFRCGQKILVYCEVEDAARQAASGSTEPRRVQFAGSLIITNPDGRVVQELAYAAGEQSTETADSPAYVVLPATIPALPPGTYHLFIGLADMPTGQFGMSAEPLSFELLADSPSTAPRR